MPSNQLAQILNKLQDVKGKGCQFTSRCPCHDDKRNSLSLSEGDGKIVVHCFAGCLAESIVANLGLKMADLFTEKGINPTPKRIIAEYNYTNKSGELLYQVVRYEPKSFVQRRKDDSGDWVYNLKGITPTLYRLPELLEAKMVWICEGEKDVENLRKQGQIATTISGGASTKWHPALVTVFFGKEVAIIPDNDEPGRAYAQYVANLLFGVAKSVKLLTLPDKDVSDYLKTNPIDNLLELRNNTTEYIPKGIVTREEFNELRGLNIYLLRALKTKGKRKSRYD